MDAELKKSWLALGVVRASTITLARATDALRDVLLQDIPPHTLLSSRMVALKDAQTRLDSAWETYRLGHETGHENLHEILQKAIQEPK